MPYFSWKGVNLKAQTCRGLQFARNHTELDAFLFKKDIALLSFHPKKIWWSASISLQTKIDYFLQLTMLIKAGMLLPDALSLIADESHNPRFAAITHEIADQVQQGISLSQALSHAPKMFDSLMIQMMGVGQESGSLAASLQVLTTHLESVALFKSRLRSALVLPAVTFFFFLMIIALMLIIIVPQFASLFASMHKELPGATKIMMAISNLLRSWYLGLVVLGSIISGYCARAYLRSARGKSFFDIFLMRFPFTKALIINKTMAGFFQSVSLLLAGGMPLVKAIRIAKESIDNSIIKAQIEAIEYEVNAGSSFDYALAGYDQLCGQEMISLIKVGQESGMLADMLTRVADIYQQRLIRILSRINTFFGPFLLIILGLLITGLIMALYAPIMSLSYAIN